MIRTIERWSWLGIVAGLTVTFTIACQLHASGGSPAGAGDAFWTRVWGSLRLGLADYAYEEADRFFHGGVGHVDEHAWQGGYEPLRKALIPHEHTHIAGATAAEVLPWLRWVVTADPTRVEAWLVAAHWLERDLQRPDLAEAALAEAALHNPGDYRVYMEWARLLLHVGRYGGARRLCRRALELWPAGAPADEPRTRLDRLQLMEWSGYLAAWAGDATEAFRWLEEVASQMPHHQMVQLELDRLRSGTIEAGTPGPALLRLRQLHGADVHMPCPRLKP